MGALLLSSCNWQPVARDVKPQLLLAGPAHVERLLDSQGRYALFTSGVGDARRYRVLTADTRQSCELPANATPLADPLLAPSLKGEDIPDFLMALSQTDPAADPNALPQLFYFDQKCRLRGPFGSVSGTPTALTLREDKRNVHIVSGAAGAISLVDPWSNQTRLIASDVPCDNKRNSHCYEQVSQADSATDPQALWLRENGKLTQRSLDGTLLLSLGTDVTAYRQLLLQGALRVAYVDNSSVFEAKGPSFTPVLVADDACGPEYAGTALTLHTPCDTQQLVRIDLITGEIKRFAQGVFNVFVQGEASFEQVATDDGDQMWVVFGNTRTQLIPEPINAISVLDKTRVVGRTGENIFGMWTLGSGFVPAFMGVSSIQTFRDSRTSRLLWLMLYEQDADMIGRLVGFDQTELERIVSGAQTTPPKALAEQVLAGSYNVFYPSLLPEPLVLTLEPPIVTQADKSQSGTLNAHLLSGSLASFIADGVSSSQVVTAPLPGILYGVLEGPSSGLWFAAL